MSEEFDLGGGMDWMEDQLELENALRKLTNKIHSSELDEILLDVKEDFQQLLKGDRVTIYVKDPVENEIFSKSKDGDDITEIRVPINSSSLAGFVALHKRFLRIENAYDKSELRQIDPSLTFDSSWDFRTGYRTKQILAGPILCNNVLQGVVQVVNQTGDKPFSEEDEKNLRDLSEALGIAFKNQKRIIGRRSKYDLLFMDEKINEDMLEQAQEMAIQEQCSIDHILLNKFQIPKQDILHSLSHFYKGEAIAFSDQIPVPFGLLEDLEMAYLKHHAMCPLDERDGTITVLMADPKNIVSRDDIQRRFGGRPMKFKVGIKEDVIDFIDYFLGGTEAEEEVRAEDMADLIGKLDSEMDFDDDVKDQKTELAEDDSAIVQLVNKIIIAAYQKGASDIHLEPYPDSDMIVRFRTDGVCREYSRLPRRYARAVLSRIKIMSGLDIAERRLPQDGKIKFKNFGPLDIELRVATLPTAAAQEDAVLRLLASSEPIPLEKMGMMPRVYDPFIKLIEQPYGIMLVVGPTGSGKTTTLHSALGRINKPERKIWTAEDPVEITQKGLRQVQVQSKIGYTFARALKAFLRADPDVIMVGEMRDYETTSAGIEASLTGHMVFSTLHTNNAPETVTRLLDMGIDPFAFGDSLLGVLAQRLVRTFCKKCKEEYQPTDQDMEELAEEFGNKEHFYELAPIEEGTVKMFRTVGCNECNNTGYKGRMGIHEFLASNDELKLLIYNKSKAEEIHRCAVKYGMYTLKQDGIEKVLMGHTDIVEVRRVCIK